MRYAIIGSGMMGQEHIRYVAMLEDAEVTAVADPDAEMRAQAAMLAGPDTAAFADYRDLLSADLADVLVVASPNHTHIDVLQDALATPLPILIEKPLCTTDADCRRILAAAQDREALVWVAMEYRYMPPTAQLLE
jgi:predicted dehydrogenase